MNFCSEGITGNVSAYCIAVPQCSDGCHNRLWISAKEFQQAVVIHTEN